MKKFLEYQAILLSCYGVIIGLLHVGAVLILGIYGALTGEMTSFLAVVLLSFLYGIITFFFYNCLAWLGLGNIFEPRPLLQNAREFYKDSWKPRSERTWTLKK